MFITLGNYLINAEQILHGNDATEHINGGEVDGLRLEFIRRGFLFIPGASKAELENKLAPAATF